MKSLLTFLVIATSFNSFALTVCNVNCVEAYSSNSGIAAEVIPTILITKTPINGASLSDEASKRCRGISKSSKAVGVLHYNKGLDIFEALSGDYKVEGYNCTKLP